MSDWAARFTVWSAPAGLQVITVDSHFKERLSPLLQFLDARGPGHVQLTDCIVWPSCTSKPADAFPHSGLTFLSVACSRPLGPQMIASLAGLPPRHAPPEPSGVSKFSGKLLSAFSGVAWLRRADSSPTTRLGVTNSVLIGLGELLRGHAPSPFAAAPAQEEEVRAAEQVRSAPPLRGDGCGGGGSERGFPGGPKGVAPLSPQELAAQLGNMEAGRNFAPVRLGREK